MTDCSPLVSIVLTTRNRREEVLRALESCLAQDYRPLDIRVYDDASDDGTCEAIRRCFPEVEVFTGEAHVERLILRNRALRDARGKYIVTLDDDCYFSDTATMSTIVDTLETCPNVAVVALRYVERARPHTSDQPCLNAKPGTELGSFAGGANAMRRECTLDIGGYREILVHHQEERDLAVRILDRGWSIMYGSNKPLVHLPSATRDSMRAWLYVVRNTVLIAYLNLPIIFLVPHVLVACAKMMLFRFKLQTLPFKLRGMLLGVADCIKYRGERRSISLATYLRYRRLPKHGPEQLLKTSAPPASRRD